MHRAPPVLARSWEEGRPAQGSVPAAEEGRRSGSQGPGKAVIREVENLHEQISQTSRAGRGSAA